MPTLSQDGSFYPGTVGFPLRIELVDDNLVNLIPGTILLTDILSAQLVIRRSDKTLFTRDLAMPASFVSGSVQYLTQSGDLTVGGSYHYVLTLFLTGDRELPVSGKFKVLWI